MGAAVLVNVVDGLLDTVHHFNAQFQVAILSSEGLHFRGAEGQIGGEPGACVNFHLEKRKSRSNPINTGRRAHTSSSRTKERHVPEGEEPAAPRTGTPELVPALLSEAAARPPGWDALLLNTLTGHLPAMGPQ